MAPKSMLQITVNIVENANTNINVFFENSSVSAFKCINRSQQSRPPATIFHFKPHESMQ